MRGLLIYVYILIIFTSCSEYQKIIKSEDYQFIYSKAVELYNQKDYHRSLNLFEYVQHVYVGTSKAQDIAHYRAYCSYHLKDYASASGLFKNFIKNYPESSNSEESLFMIGYCEYLASPKARLDQQISKSALGNFQLYLDRYPNSERKDQINIYMDELYNKLTYKDFLNARNYFHREHYKSAIISFKNCLKDFPNTEYREEIMFMIFISAHEMAINSIAEKQLERYNDALEEFYVFSEEFPESKHKQEIAIREKNIKEFLKNIE